ncbi:MAG: NAD(P)-binding domain-containing protein, partial [Solirubrobacteraceae bacterium]
MGLPICARLVGAGFEVAATDLRAELEAGVRGAGARWVPNTAVLIDEADVVLTVLPGSAEVQEVMAGAMARLRPGMAWIDMS